MNKWLRTKLNMQPEPEAKVFPAPVFIVGCMRSGTTLLVDKLTQHPQLLKVGSELRRVWTQVGGTQSDEICAYSGAEDADFEAADNMTYYFSQYITRSQSSLRHIMRAKNALRFGHGSIFYDWEHVRPVNKSTHLVNKIAYLHQLFPRAQFVFIIRDILGQAASMKRFIERHHKNTGVWYHMPKASKDYWHRLHLKAKPESEADYYPVNFEIIPKMWLRMNVLALRELQQLPPHLYHIVPYEELVMNQAEVLQGVFAFLNLLPKYQAKVAKIVGQTLKMYNTHTAGNPLEKWKRDLFEEEIAFIENLKNEEADKYAFIFEALNARHS